MTDRKATTPVDIVAKGGSFDGESTTNKRKCVSKAMADSAWLRAHGCYINNVTGYSYSNTQRVLCIDDISINSGQSTTVYVFRNYDVNRTLFVRASNRTICTQMQQVITSGGQQWGGAIAEIVDGWGDGSPVVMYYNDYVPPTSWTWTSESGVIYQLEQQGYSQSNMVFLYPEGSVPLDGTNNTTVGSQSLFSLGTHIVLDFGGANCRNKYFSFIVGGNEFDVLTYARGGTPADHEGVSMGWAESIKQGPTSRRYIDNAEIVNWYQQGRVNQNYDIPEYKSIHSVWVSNVGFSVIFKDTDAINDDAKEVFIVGLNRDTNPATWNTDSDGFIIECRNFTMS